MALFQEGSCSYNCPSPLSVSKIPSIFLARLAFFLLKRSEVVSWIGFRGLAVELGLASVEGK
jgi:hypothetical protein